MRESASDGDSEEVGDKRDTDGLENAPTAVRTYYRALDDHDYEALESVLTPGFTQRRPDRTFESPEAFIRFMREERPMTDTRHEILGVVVDADGERATVRGRLLEPAGETVFGFADVFTLENGRLSRLETYTR